MLTRIRQNVTAFNGIPTLITSRYYRTSVAADTKETGLYGFHHLKTPGGFQRFVDDAIERAGELINSISDLPSAAEIVRAMDEISDTVCSVVDSAELCRHTHPDREFVDEATKAAIRMGEYLHHLNTNNMLYKAVIKAEREGDGLIEEAQRAAHHLRLDFEKGGIHLPADKKEQVNELNLSISHLWRKYDENIMADPGYVDVYPTSHLPRRLHYLAKPIYRTASGVSRMGLQTETKEKGYRIATDPETLSCILQWTSDAEVRRMAYLKGNSAAVANLDILLKLIAARHELAQLMGCKSYAEFSMHRNLASSPEVVTCFLHEMSDVVRPKANQEIEAIRSFKRERTGQMLEDVEPWDETYFTSLMKSQTYSLQSSVVASYFPLMQCIEGMKVLVESLFGATFYSISPKPGESWHPDVIKLSLHHPEEGDLGLLYLDLCSRKGKYPGCAHFAIRGGRQISEAEYQLPVVALVCNFSSISDPSTARLNHWELETLFHEFGHALHSLLSRTQYQHFSGTRVALDLAETPSNLFEYYAWDYRVLKTFARHYSTGETIPEKLVESMRGAKRMFAATDLQRQVYFAITDQMLFGSSPPRDTVSVVADLRRQYTSSKHVEGTHWHTRFSHLLNYGAGYYSYLYAKCFAATIWQKLCQEDPLSPATGDALRLKFFRHGGAKDPVDLLNDLVGNGIVRPCNGGVIPDITAFCEEMELP